MPVLQFKGKTAIECYQKLRKSSDTQPTQLSAAALVAIGKRHLTEQAGQY